MCVNSATICDTSTRKTRVTSSTTSNTRTKDLLLFVLVTIVVVFVSSTFINILVCALKR
jgi:hypothetical protein